MAWKFKDPPNVAVIVDKKVIHEGLWIAQVSHDSDDGQWIFYSSEELNDVGAAIVGLSEIIKLDASVEELASLPLGWHAWRTGPSEPWERAKITTETS